MSAHDSFVIGTTSTIVWLVLLGVATWRVSHLIKSSSTLRCPSSWIELTSASGVVELVTPSLIWVLELISSSSESTSSTVASVSSSSASRSLIAIVPLHALERQVHQLLRDGIIWLSKLGITVSEMAFLTQHAVFVGFEMSASLCFVFLVDFILSLLANLRIVEILLVLSILWLSHVHLVHLLMLHHLHLVLHHSGLHLHLHVISWHHTIHLIRCVHIKFKIIY